MYNCFFDNNPEYNRYEIFVDESKASKLNNNDYTYGVYYDIKTHSILITKFMVKTPFKMPHYKEWK